MTARLHVLPTTRDAANAYVTQHHRHNKRVQGHRFAIQAVYSGALVGIAIVGNPVARPLNDGLTAEVTRCCTDGGRHRIRDRWGNVHTLPVCSFLYGRCWQIWRAMGGRRIVTYTLQEEQQTSLKALGWRCVAELPERAGTTWDNRPGRARQEVSGAAKFRWEQCLDGPDPMADLDLEFMLS
ncbi:XF1762 family protein [Azospirillum argentinense]|uniref:Uncharacterized protein n=1 Tax=Azospirillum brasilense TaxID=192 RepID=A0A4D8Q3K0_AZOBR|nr:XF1762 family protein [Azospirillum argentinense]QCO03046.1 hypothetical protein D3867_14105 [Azospirillum argentinense]